MKTPFLPSLFLSGMLMLFLAGCPQTSNDGPAATQSPQPPMVSPSGTPEGPPPTLDELDDLPKDPEALIERLNKVVPGETYEDHLKRGQILMINGKEKKSERLTQAAIYELTKCIGLQPKSSEPYHLRAQAHVVAGDDEAALKDFEAAILFDATNHEALASRGALYSRQKNWKAALEDFSRAYYLEPRADYRLGEAICQMNLGNEEEAKNLYHQLAIQNDNPQIKELAQKKIDNWKPK